MAYDPNLGFDPNDPYGTPPGSSLPGGFVPNPTTSNPDPNATGGTPQPLPTGPQYQTPVNNPNPPPTPPPTPPPGTNTTTTGQGTAPSYVNSSDPMQAAIWAAYQKKGITPRDQADFQYWIDRINQTGGWSNPGNQSYWLSRMAQASGGVGDYSGAPEAGSGGVAGGLTTGMPNIAALMAQYGITVPQATAGSQVNTTAPSTIPMQAQATELYNQLMARSQQSLNVNPNDPIIANQVDAFKANEQSGVRNYLNQLAESSGPQSNLGSEARIANQQATQATGQMQAQLIQNELTARRTEIAQALQEMGSQLTAQQQISMQQQLAYLDAALRQNQMNLQNSQFYAGLGMQGQQLAMQYDEFLRQLGLNAQQQSWWQNQVNSGLKTS